MMRINWPVLILLVATVGGCDNTSAEESAVGTYTVLEIDGERLPVRMSGDQLPDRVCPGKRTDDYAMEGRLILGASPNNEFALSLFEDVICLSTNATVGVDTDVIVGTYSIRDGKIHVESIDSYATGSTFINWSGEGGEWSDSIVGGFENDRLNLTILSRWRSEFDDSWVEHTTTFALEKQF